MMVEDLANLRRRLKNVAKNLTDLLVHEWPSALDITNELHRLQEAVDEYSLNQIWFSAHARVDGIVMMVTTPEIRRVSQMICENVTLSLRMIVTHSIYFRKFCKLSIGCVHNAHTKYEADWLDWQSVINDGNELLCKADILQFKELCNNNYILCKDEYHLYNQWTQVMEGRPRYVSIMYGWIIDEDEQAWNEDESRFNDSSDNNRRHAFFLAHHQMLAHHQWLSYCPEEAALF